MWSLSLKPSTALSHNSSCTQKACGWDCVIFPFSRELVDSLHQRNVKVFLISGGFRCIVEHVAAQLNIPQHHVYANRLKFYFNGESLTPHPESPQPRCSRSPTPPLSSRRVRRFRRESAHSWERRQRKGHQHPEGALRLQDGGDDRRRRHRPGGVPSRRKRPGFAAWMSAFPETLQPHSRLLVVDRAPLSALEGTWSGSRWRSAPRGTWRVSGSW